jgi:hypothetical protein
MTGLINVYRVEESQTTVWIFSADSLAEALERIRNSGAGDYVVESVRTLNRRLYAVKTDGKMVYVGRV